jgi:hypothetical protein
MMTSEPLLPLDLPQTELVRLWATPMPSDVDGGRTTKGRYRQAETGLRQQALMSSAAASPARTSATQARAQALMASAAGYGRSTPDLLASYDRASSSWRTSQLCLEGGLHVFSETWPRSGTMRNGTAFQLPPLVRLTDETGFGSWATPAAADATGSTGGGQGRSLRTDVRMWPTPNAGDGIAGASNLPHRRQVSLPRTVAQWPTPTADRYSGLQSHGRNAILGSLNPTWVEWLMGFPSGYTDCGR